MRKGLKMGRLIGAMSVVAIVGLSGSAFTAANTVPTSKAGDGNNTITGYAAEAVDYTLASDPKQIASVAFKITSQVTAGSEVKIQLDTPSGSWYSCTLGTWDATAGKHPVTCTTTGATVAAADQLTLVIAD